MAEESVREDEGIPDRKLWIDSEVRNVTACEDEKEAAELSSQG